MFARSLSDYTNDKLVLEASQLATLIKACLVRTTFNTDYVIGKDEDGVSCTADFSVPRNRNYVDQKFIPLARDMLLEADARGMTTVMTQMFSPQGLLAIELGTTELDFQDLTKQIYTEAQSKQDSSSGSSEKPSAGAIILSFLAQKQG